MKYLPTLRSTPMQYYFCDWKRKEVGFSTGKKSHHIVIRCAILWWFWFYFMGESGKPEQNSDFEFHDTNEWSRVGRSTSPARKGFPSRWTSKGALALTEHALLAAVVVRKKKPLRCCFGCLEFVLVAQLLLDGHNTRDIGQGYADALPLRGGRCTGAVSGSDPVRREVSVRH